MGIAPSILTAGSIASEEAARVAGTLTAPDAPLARGISFAIFLFDRGGSGRFVGTVPLRRVARLEGRGKLAQLLQVVLI